MAHCNQCAAPLGVTRSTFPGWDLLACTNCGRPVKLLPINGPRPRGTRPARRGDLNRALRAARRIQQQHRP